MKAYILITCVNSKATKTLLNNVNPGKCRRVLFDEVTGPYDFIMKVEAQSLDDINKFVREIVAIDGVISATACLADTIW